MSNKLKSMIFLALGIVFISCGSDEIYEKNLYGLKLKELEVKAERLEKEVLRLENKKKAWREVTILVAKRNIRKGRKIHPDLLMEAPIPKRYLKTGMFSPKMKHYIQGLVVTRSISRGEPIFEEDLSHIHQLDNITNKLNKETERAVTLSSKEALFSTKLILPDTYVDILWAYKDEKTGEWKSKVLLEQVKVLAIGKYTMDNLEVYVEKESLYYKEITFLLSLKEAMLLNLAKETGKLAIVLKSQKSFHKETEKTSK